MSESVTIDGVTFPPVLVPDTTSRRDGRTYKQAEVNGRPLYAIPGGMMAYLDDLPRIAKSLKIPRDTPLTRK
jgi:hypothetical protein